jgi:hypothetical protein
MSRFNPTPTCYSFVEHLLCPTGNCHNLSYFRTFLRVCQSVIHAGERVIHIVSKSEPIDALEEFHESLLK